MNKKTVSLLVLGVFVLVFTAIAVFGGAPLLQYVKDPSLFRELARRNPLGSRALFVGMSLVQIVIAVIPGEPFEIAAGAVFGAVEGTVLCLVSCLIGSAFVFLLTRKFGTKLLTLFFDGKEIRSLAFLKDAKKLRLATAIVFLIPGTPKDLLTYGAGLTDIDMTSFLLIATVCRLPSVVTSTWGGDALLSGDISVAVAAFSIAAALGLVGIWYWKRKTA